MKSWYASKTMWGGIASLVLASSGVAVNIDFATGDFHGNIYQLYSQIGGVIAALAVLHGRLNATREIKRRK